MPATPDKKTSVTLEQLLHVKRAERPAPAFWEEFDREFRRRQLASVVIAQPWHARLARIALATLRRAAPVGAAAAAVFAGFLALDRSNRPSQVEPVQMAQSEPEISTHVVAIPDEQISPSAAVAVQDEPTISTTVAMKEEPRYVMQELVSAERSTRFVNLTSPHMLSGGGRTETYVVNTLTTGAALHATARPVSGSF